MLHRSGYRLPVSERPSRSTLNIRDRLRTQLEQRKKAQGDESKHMTPMTPSDKSYSEPPVYYRRAGSNSTNIYLYDPI